MMPRKRAFDGGRRCRLEYGEAFLLAEEEIGSCGYKVGSRIFSPAEFSDDRESFLCEFLNYEGDRLLILVHNEVKRTVLWIEARNRIQLKHYHGEYLSVLLQNGLHRYRGKRARKGIQIRVDFGGNV